MFVSVNNFWYRGGWATKKLFKIHIFYLDFSQIAHIALRCFIFVSFSLMCRLTFELLRRALRLCKFYQKMIFIRLVLFLSVLGMIAPQNSNNRLSQPVKTPVGLKDQSNTTRIVYPSEDTNKNRRPTHVS